MPQNVTTDRRARRILLWFGWLGGPIAWLLHLVLAYTLAEASCVTGFPGFTVGGVSGGLLLILAVTLLMLAVTVAAGYAAYRSGRQIEEEPHNGQAPGAHRGVRRYMARSGLYLSILFVFIIAVETLPVFFWYPCP